MAAATQRTYDFFLLVDENSEEDRDIAEKILDHLESQPAAEGQCHLTGYYSPRDAILGKSEIYNVVHSIEKSRVVFVLISKSAIEDCWWRNCAHTLLVDRLGKGAQAGPIIPLCLHGCKEIPMELCLLEPLHYEDDAEFWTQLSQCV